jgi:hypothetical protein
MPDHAAPDRHAETAATKSSAASRVVPQALFARLGDAYETHRRPQLVLAGLVLVLYLPALAVPLFIEDHRNLRLMREFAAGARPSLDLYRFRIPAGRVAELRASGRIPWWISDDARAEFMRPLAEWSLYADYRLWGHNPIGYHITALVLYAASVLLVLMLFRAVQPDETRARWAALIFAVTGAHAVNVAFIAARCDLLCLLGTLAAVLCGVRFAQRGGWWRLAVAIVMAVVALLSKEAAAPLALGFGLLWLIGRHRVGDGARPAADRRAWLTGGALLVVTVVWLGARIAGGYVTNVALIVNPLQRPLDYLRVAPVRAFEYFATWPLGVNPLLFYQQPASRPTLLVVAAVGAVCAIALVAYLWRSGRLDRAAAGLVIWPLLYVPILACAPPDARLLMIPNLGLAYLGATWLCAGRGRGGLPPRWLRVAPVVLLIGFNVLICVVSLLAIIGLEVKSRTDLHAMIANIAEQTDPADACAYAIIPQGFTAAWTQDRAENLFGPDVPRFAFLCDVSTVDVAVVGPQQLRLRAADQPLLSTLLGRYGRVAGESYAVGQRFLGPGFVVEIAELGADGVAAIDVTFDRALDDRTVALFHLTNASPPRRWVPSQGAQEVLSVR